MRIAIAIFITGLLLGSTPVSCSTTTTCLGWPPLKPIRRICGFVIDRTGSRVPNARVTVLKDGQELGVLQTDQNGKFRFEQLPPGNYQIRVDADGFRSAYASVVVTKPGAKSRRVLEAVLDVGMGCPGIGEVSGRKYK